MTTAIRLMTRGEAQAAVSQIRANLESARQLLLELYEREGWRALGYSSWRECAVAEFGQSQGHVYRLLCAAQVERVVSPAGENGKNRKPAEIPERVLRPLVGLSEGTQKRVWQAATANGDMPTAAEVAELAEEALGVEGLAELTREQQREVITRAEKKALTEEARVVGGEGRRERLAQCRRLHARLVKCLAGVGPEAEGALAAYEHAEHLRERIDP